MICPSDKAKNIEKVIKKVHPYEEIAIDVVKLEKI
jgi:hypothetical protein